MAEATDRRVPVVVRAFSPEGYECSFDLSLALSDLPEALKRLQQAGYTPQSPRPATAPPSVPGPRQNGGSKATKVMPRYDPATGVGYCPVHGNELRDGRYGPYCPARAEAPHANEKGYCSLKFEG